MYILPCIPAYIYIYVYTYTDMYPIQLTNNDNRPTSNPTESTHPDAIDTRNIPMSQKTKHPKVQKTQNPKQKPSNNQHTQKSKHVKNIYQIVQKRTHTKKIQTS